MRRIKVGILGATRGMQMLAQGLRGSDKAEVAAICENYPPALENARARAQEMGVSLRTYTEFDDMLASDIDAVVLANFANKHAPFAIRALRAGKHVLSEVLPTQTLAEAVALCEAVEESGKVYAYGENYCYMDTVLEIRRLLESGELGNVTAMEGTFINDCSRQWPRITRGDRSHWRNYVPSTFYCTHSIGPMLFVSGLRPVRVSALETPCLDYMNRMGARTGSAAMQLLELNNSAMAHSVQGNLKRGFTTAFNVYTDRGSAETDRYDLQLLHVLLDPRQECRLDCRNYHPATLLPEGAELRERSLGGCSDWYVQEAFFSKILGESFGEKYAIDVYSALDMSLPGLMAYRSILDGGRAYDIPDMRDRAARERYRHDHTCTDPEVAGESLLPENRRGNIAVDDEVYARVHDMFLRGEHD